MKEVIKFIINVLLLGLYIVGLWVIGSRIGVDLLVVLWNAGMQWEAIVAGVIIWDWLIGAILKITLGIIKEIEKAGI